MPDEPAPITEFLDRWSEGDSRALNEVLPMVYAQLRGIAQSQLRRERPGHTLQPTALVNELYLRLAHQHGGRWRDRGHFFSFCAMLMRRILIDYAKCTLSEKRGGGCERVPVSDNFPWLSSAPEDLLSLDLALDTLERFDERKARIIELRVLLGCTATESAEILEISKRTADREWTLARAWLFRALHGAGEATL